MEEKQKKIIEEKEKLARYLYPTHDLIKFMCNDLYQELLEIIPLEYCISEDNLDDIIRTKNREFINGAIKGYMCGNKIYQKILFKQTNHNNLDLITRDVLIGFVLYISSLSDDFVDIDIIDDKQSILYGEVFILDIVD